MSCVSHENNDSWFIFLDVSALEQGREQGCLLGDCLASRISGLLKE